MVSKRILAAALCFLLIFLASTGSVYSGDFTVSSDPQGAQVTLTGDLIVSGITPAVFRQPLIGDYRLEVQKYGFETYKTRVILDPSKNSVVQIQLRKKTALRAALHSLVIPGWGQRYSSKKTKGFLFSMLAAGSIVGYFITDNDFDDKFDLYEKKRDEFDEASISGSYAEVVRLHGELLQRQEDAFDAEDRRRFAIGAAAVTWGLSLLDAFLFFPEERGTFSVKSLSIGMNDGSQSPGLKLSVNF